MNIEYRMSNVQCPMSNVEGENRVLGISFFYSKFDKNLQKPSKTVKDHVNPYSKKQNIAYFREDLSTSSEPAANDIEVDPHAKTW